MFPGLDGKRVVITAAAQGIGRATAVAFMAAGARVHICDIDGPALAALAKAQPGLGVSLADAGDEEQIDSLFDDAVAHLGGLDVLVNNAGVAGPTGNIEDMPPDEWRRAVDINLNGHFYCLRRAVPLLKAAGGGSIVGLASTAGVMGYPHRAPYAATKWAVVGITKSLAIELGDFGIRVNCVNPGPVSGDRIDRVIAAEAAARGVARDEVRASYTRNISLHTFIAAEDIAAAILFLCSDAGAKITGQAISVDGNTETLANR